ncbi:MAG: tetratricopeptide (TPR) repeat protein [Crocinitomix sp.]|jgi:tetratricopeptide (TPR) repeat protein
MSRFVKFTFLITALSTFSVAYAQPEKEVLREKLKDANFSQKFEVGVNLFYDKIYIDALYVWEILLEEDPKNANLLYKSGMCYISLNKEAEALPFFKKAQYSVDKNYNPFSYLERNAPPEVLYYLAQSNHVNGSIDSAAAQYTFFVDNTNKKHDKYKRGVLGKKQCANAKRLIASPRPYIIKNIGSMVNKTTPEYSPVISVDGTTLFFTSKRLRLDSTNFEQISYENGLYYEDIYICYRDRDGNWTEPEYLGFCRPRRNDASISSSADGQTVFVYQDINGGDVYYSENTDTSFNNLQKFPAEELNTEHWESHATMSNDENYLYFVSDRPGGLGGRDIYRLKKLPNGEWSKAFNLGPTINSEFDEESPFLGVDNKTMYYSSNGPRSMGGFDIFVTQIDEEDHWSEPVNMGYPLNTVDDDIFYTTTADGRTGYYSSEKLDGQGDKDIYSVYGDNDYIQNVAVLTGFILTSDDSRIPPGISIEVQDLSENSGVKKYSPRRRDGGYVLTLLPCHTYQIDYFLNDTNKFHQTELYVPCNSSYQEIKHELLLDMVDLTAVPVLTEEDSVVVERKEKGMACNLVYKIQVGAFKKDLPVSYYKKYNPISTELLGKNITRYMLGAFDEYILAEKVRQEVLDKYEDAFVVAYLNAVRIPTSTARDLENGVIQCDESLYPKVESHIDSLQLYTNLIKGPNYQHFFGYNKDKFDYKNDNFRVFVQGIKEIIDNDLPVTVIITSSASHVPTRAYKDNQDLAVHRLNNGKSTLTTLLLEFGVDLTKINIVLQEASVNGPKYKNDAKENRYVYQKFQYIKFDLEF